MSYHVANLCTYSLKCCEIQAKSLKKKTDSKQQIIPHLQKHCTKVRDLSASMGRLYVSKTTIADPLCNTGLLILLSL